MKRLVADALWPVLLALVALVGGALVLEEYVRRHGNAAVVVAIHETAAPALADDAADESETPESDAPLDELHARARVAARRGELDEALRLFAQVAEQHAGAAGVRDEYGSWLLAARRPREALAQFEAARGLAPDDAHVALHLGQARVRLEEPGLAEVELRRAVSLRAGFGAAQRALGRLLRKRKRVEEAIAVLREAAASGGNEERALSLVELGTAQLSAGRRKEAEVSLAQAIEFAPARVEIRLAGARAWLSSSDKEDHVRALEAIRRAAELAPDLAAVHGLLGRALERTGDRAGAEAAYEQALRLAPDYHLARRRLLRMALDRKDFLRARGQAAQLLAAAPEEPEHYFLSALVADRDGHEDEARRLYRDALAHAKGDYPEAWFNLGLMEKRAGHLTEALAAYEKALALRPTYLAALNNLALTRAAAGDAGGAEQALREALRADPGYAVAWLNLGELFAKQERLPLAIEALQHALAAKSDYPQARLSLGLVLTRAGRPEEAMATYRQLVADQPRSVAGWFNLALLARAGGMGAQAREALTRALEIDPEHAPSLRTLAELDQDAGALDMAVDEWRDLLDRDPADRGARLSLAELLLRRGDAAGCARTVEPLLSRSPEDDEARRLVTRCAGATAPQ